MRYLFILFIPMFSLEGIPQQNDFLVPHYQEYDEASMSYSSIQAFSSNMVSSDYGARRIPGYDWHSGIDYTCIQCENNVVLSCLKGSFYYGDHGGLRYVIIDGTSDLAYLHLFNSLPAGNCNLIKMKGKPNINVVTIDYNGVILAFAEEIGIVNYKGIEYEVENFIEAGQPLGPVGGSGGFPVHVHMEELPDEIKTISNDRISKNPLQTLHYNAPDYSEVNLFHSTTNDINKVSEGIAINYPGNKFNAILIRPIYPNAIDNGHKFTTINNINKVGLQIRNLSLNDSWEFIEGPNFRSEFKYGGLLGETPYPNSILGPSFGSFKSTGIYPDAYADAKPKDFDNFIYCDFYHRIHMEDPMKGNKSLRTSNCPTDSRYVDGNYEFKSYIQSIGGDITEGSVYNARIDNFQPYIQSVTVLIDGYNVYSAFWECGIDGPEFSGYECKATVANANSIITIMVDLSEVVSNLNGRIIEFPGNFVPFGHQGGLSWSLSFQNFNFLKDGDIAHLEFSGIDINGNQILDLRAMAGGKITSKINVKIPIRENSTSWKPLRKGGIIDDVHQFCFKSCNKFRNEELSNGLKVPDCIGSDDLKLTYETESFNDAGDGWIHLEISGGFPPYFVHWTDPVGNTLKQGINEFDLTDLISGTYCYSIQDAHCCNINSCITLCPSITLGVNTGLTQPSDCNINDGSIRIISGKANGGQFPYEFHLEDIYKNRIYLDPISGKYEELFAGKYFYIATDANGCEGSYLIELVTPEDFYVHQIITKDCNGGDGEIYIEAFSNLYPDDTYDFNWSTGINEKGVTESTIDQLMEGRYCFTITSNTTNCSKQDCIDVKGSGKPLSFKYNTIIPCHDQKNGEIKLTVAGGAKPYRYIWSNGEFRSSNSKLPAGDYCVTITDDCLNSIKQCFDLSKVLSLNLTMEYRCPDKVTILSHPLGGNPPYTYSWSNGAITKDLVEVGIGIYKLSVTDRNGCLTVKVINTNPIELLNPVKPCEGFWDGEMTIKINNPNNEQVNVSYEFRPCDDCTPIYKIRDDYSNPVTFTLKNLAGNKEYHFYVRIGMCIFEINFVLGEEDLKEIFNRYEESNGIASCMYDLVCKDDRIEDGRRKDPIITHTRSDCQKFIFKKCADVEIRCLGNPEIVKTIEGKVVHMRRLEAMNYAAELGLDPSPLKGNFCDHLWICHDDPFCIVAQARGEFGGKFKGIERSGDCYKVKCRSFFGLINQDYKICGEDFIPDAFLPYYRDDRHYEGNGNKPKECTPMTLNFTDVLECWPKFVKDDDKKFYESAMAKLVDSYRERRERYCAWVTFCLEDYSIISTNINDFECEDFNPPINVGNWLVHATCDPHSYEGNDIVFCECEDPEITKRYGICLEPKLLPQRCTVTLTKPEESKAIQFIPFQNGNTFFNSFSTVYQPENFTTLNGLFEDSNGNNFYQKYEPGELFNPLEEFEGATFVHQNAQHNRINLITKGVTQNAYEIYSGSFNTIDLNSISSDQYLKLISCYPFEKGFIAIGEFSGHLIFGEEMMAYEANISSFLFYMNDVTSLAEINILSGARPINKNHLNANSFLMQRTSSEEAILLNGKTIQLVENSNTFLLKIDINGEIIIEKFMNIQKDINIIDFKESSDGSRYVLGSAKGQVLIDNDVINLPVQKQCILMKWFQNELLWYRNFDQIGIDEREICIETTNDNGVVLGLNVGTESALFKNDLNYLNSIGSDIVIVRYDQYGSKVYENRFGSIHEDEWLKSLYYSEENVLYIGGNIEGPILIRTIGDLDLIKSAGIDHSAFISYINFNDELTNEIRKNYKTEIDEIQGNLSWQLIPNPVRNQLKIKFEFGSFKKIIPEVYDITGKLIPVSAFTDEANITINTSNLNSGIYILKLKNGPKNFSTKRFIKI